MKTDNEIRKWIIVQLGRRALGALTSQDWRGLCASIAITPLISYAGAKPELFAAYAAVVREMQPSTRYLAFHTIAMELDWSHRFMIWSVAKLPEEDMPMGKCCFEDGGGGQERSDALNNRKKKMARV